MCTGQRLLDWRACVGVLSGREKGTFTQVSISRDWAVCRTQPCESCGVLRAPRAVEAGSPHRCVHRPRNLPPRLKAVYSWLKRVPFWINKQGSLAKKSVVVREISAKMAKILAGTLQYILFLLFKVSSYFLIIMLPMKSCQNRLSLFLQQWQDSFILSDLIKLKINHDEASIGPLLYIYIIIDFENKVKILWI